MLNILAAGLESRGNDESQTLAARVNLNVRPVVKNAPQGAFTTNFVLQLDEASKHFAHIIKRMMAEGYTRFDVKPEVEDKYVDLMWKMSPISNGKRPVCTPGYYNDEGKVEKAGTQKLGGMFPGGPLNLFQVLEKEREDGTALDCFNLA